MADDFEDVYGIEEMDDDEVHDLIVQEFEDTPDLDPDLIEVEVDLGHVTLSGRVGTAQELALVQEIIADTLNIDTYSNGIVVDELVRAQYSEGADDAVVEDDETEAQIGEEEGTTSPMASHLDEDLAADSYGTRDMKDAIERGQSYNPPERAPGNESGEDR